MEIEKIVSNVQEKVGNTDFSAQTIRKACELYPVAEGSEPDEAYYTKVADFVKGMQGQYNHDFSTKFSEAKKNLLTENTFKNMSEEQLSQVKALIEGLRSEASAPADNEEVTLLKQQLEEMKSRLDANDKEKKHLELLHKVKASMREQKANDEYVLEQTLRDADFDESKTLEQLTEEYLAKYDSEYLRCRGGDVSPRKAGVGSGETTSWLDRKFAQKAAKEGWAKN